MTILLLSYEYPPETGFGGIGTYTWHHARALVRLGHRVHVLAGATQPMPMRVSVEDGVVVHRWRADGLLMRLFGLGGRKELWSTSDRLRNGWSMYRGLLDLLERVPIDVIEMPECGGEGWAINQLLGERTVVRFHSPAQLILEWYGVRPLDFAGCSAIEAVGIAGATARSSCSRFLADEVTTRLGVRQPIDVIPNGLDLEWFDASETVDIRRRFGIPADRPMVLFTGRMEQRKGIHLCPEIVGTLIERLEVAFVFAGRDLFGYVADTFLPDIQRRRARGSVHFLGPLDLRLVRACLKQADVFFLPSLWENCPYSVLEAMAAGVAIVCSRQGGLPELIEHERTGLLATAGDPHSFVAALDRLLADRPLRQRLSTAARTELETSFSSTRVAERAVALYRRTTGDRKPATAGS